MTIQLLALTLALATQITPPAAPAATPPSSYSCRSLSGETVDFASTRGKVVVMTFVNTECSTCVRVTLRVAGAYKQLASQDRTAFILIAVNPDADTKLQRFTQDVALPFSACVDAKANVERFLGIPTTGALLTPTVVVFDGNGVVREAMPPSDKRLSDPTTIKEAIERVLTVAPSNSASR